MKSSKLRSWSFQVSDLLMILVDVTSSCLVEWLEKMWESLREKGKGDSKEKGRGEEGKEKDSFPQRKELTTEAKIEDRL